jgi:hypothetical protein
MTATRLFVVFTLFTGPLFSMIAFTREGRRLNSEALTSLAVIVLLISSIFTMVVPVQPVTTQAAGDLIVTKVEAVQAPYGVDRLVLDKDLVVRVEITSTFANLIRTTITYDINYPQFGGCQYTGAFIQHQDVDLINGLNVFNLIHDGGTRGQAVTQCVKAGVDIIGNTIQETVENNNEKFSTYIVKDTKPLNILYVNLDIAGNWICDTPTNCRTPLDTDLQRFDQESYPFLKDTFPIDEDEFSSSVWPTQFPVPISLFPQGGRFNSNDLTQASSELEDFRTLLTRTSGITFDHIVGVVNRGWYNKAVCIDDTNCNMGSLSLGTALLGQPGNPKHSSIIEENFGVGLAHEIAHNYGWVPSGNNAECRTSPNHTCGLAAPGYWVSQGRPISAGTTDLMENPTGVHRWISKETFNYLFDNLKTNPADPPIIALRAKIFKNGTTEVGSWFKFESIPDIPLNNPGDYKILYLDESGKQIAQTGFDFQFLSIADYQNEPVEADVGIISLFIPDVNGTKKIVVNNGTELLFERTLSSYPPDIKILSPKEEESFNRNSTLNITWEALDPDNTADELMYVVSVSQDNGQSWIPIAFDLTSKKFSYVLPPYLSPGSTLIKVEANDGINTTEDTVAISIVN